MDIISGMAASFTCHIEKVTGGGFNITGYINSVTGDVVVVNGNKMLKR